MCDGGKALNDGKTERVILGVVLAPCLPNQQQYFGYEPSHRSYRCLAQQRCFEPLWERLSSVSPWVYSLFPTTVYR